jgi:phage-related protein
MPSTRTEITVLLMIEAIDKAGDLIAGIGTKLDAMGAAIKKAGGDAILSGQELADAQLKAEAAGTAWRTSVDEQAVAMERLRITTEALKNAQTQQALVTEGDAKAAADAAKTVSVASAEQVAALDALKKAEDGVAERAVAMADAQKLASTESTATGVGLKQVGTAAALTAAAVVGIGYASVKAAAQFQQATTVLATSGGETVAELGAARDGILNIAQSTGTATQQLTNGLYMIGSAGYDVAHGGLKVLTAAAQGAKAENADLGTVSNALTTILKDYGMGADQATVAMDKMITVVQNGKTTTQDLAGSLANVLPLASAVHLSFDQVGGALASMTGQGMSAYQATQDLNNSIRALSNPNNVAINEMQMLGINATKLSEDLSSKGLTGTLDVLTNAIKSHFGPAGTVVISTFQQSATATQKVNEMMAGMTPTLKNLAQSFLDGSISQKQWRADLLALSPEQDHMMTQFATLANKAHGFNTMLTQGSAAEQTAAAALSKMMGGATGLNTALMLTGDNAKTFNDNVQKVSDTSKNAGKDVNGWSLIQETLNQKLSILKETVNVAAIRLGTALLPAVTTMVTWIMKIVQPIADWIGHNQKLAATLLILLGIVSTVITTFVVVMKVITMVREAWTAFTAIMAATEFNPVVLAITLLAVALYLIITHWSTVKKWILDFWDWLKKTAQEAWTFIKGHVDQVAGAVAVLLGPIGIIIAIAMEIIKHWSTVKKWFDDFWGWMKQGASAVADWFKGIWGGISKPLTDEWNHIVTDLTSIWQSLTTIWNATGGKLVSLISRNWDDITGWSKRAWALIYGWVKGYMDLIMGYLKGAWDLVQGIFHIAWDIISGYVKTAWDLISTVVKMGIDYITAILKAGWDVILGVVKIVWEMVKTTINTVLDAIKDIFKLFADLVTGKWSKLWGDVENIFKDIWNNIWSFIKSILGTIGNTVANAVSDLWTGFINGIVAAGNGIWKALQDLASMIGHAFVDAGKWLWQAGKDIVNGLIDGITSMGSSLIQTVTTLGGLIPKWKGPPEKDKVMLVHNGQLIMQGLLDGIDSQTQALKNKLQGVTGDITATVNPVLAGKAVGASAVAPASPSSGTTVINFSFPNSNIAGPNSIKWIMDQVNKQFVQKAVPAAGIKVTRQSA